MIDIEKIEGQVQASAVKRIAEIFDKHPDEAVSVLRNWLTQRA
jgi:flagellar M-ring protein FliF